MISQIFSRCWAVFTALFLMAVPLWAAKDDAQTTEWVTSYIIIVAFLALTLLILLRPTKRSDSAFSYDEQQSQKAEDMKKITGKG